MGDMDAGWAMTWFLAGALAWATVGEWCIRSLARYLSRR